MEIRVCPRCNKAFYAPTSGDLINCSHCGYILLDRRNRERIGTEKRFRFLFKGKMTSAEIRDYSEGGIRIIYRGQPLSVDTFIDLDIDELNIHETAKAVWTKRTGLFISTGLKFA